MTRGRIIFNLFGIKWLPVAYKVTIPDSFDEMSYKQLLWWVEHVYNKLSDFLQIEEDKVLVSDMEAYTAKRIEMCRILCNCPKWLWFTVSAESIRDMIYTWGICNFTFETIYKPKHNPVHKIADFYGPIKADHLQPWEFSFADAFYLAYKSNKNLEFLDRFIAQLYREPRNQDNNPENYTTDKRVRYNNEADDLRMDAVKKAPLSQKLLAMYWYQSWRNSLPGMFKHLFSKKNSGEAAKQQSWLPIFQAAANGVHNFEAIKSMNLLILFSELDRLMKQQKESERRLKGKK